MDDTEPDPGTAAALAEAAEKRKAARLHDVRATRALPDTSGPGLSPVTSPKTVFGADKENTDVGQRQRAGEDPDADTDEDVNVEGTAKHDASSVDDTVERDSDAVTVDPTTAASPPPTGRRGRGPANEGGS
jgi:hypothetical protein